MFTETKRHIIRLVIIFGVLLLSFYVFYIFLLDTTFKREANLIAHNEHELRTQSLDDMLHGLYDAYQDGILNWNTKQYTTELNPLVPFNMYTISPLSTLFSDEVDDTLVLVLKKEGEQEVAYKEVESVFANQGVVLSDTQYVVATSGYILYAKDQSLISKNFFNTNLYPSQYFGTLDNLIGKNSQAHFDFQSNNESFILSFHKLDGDLLFISIVKQAPYLAAYLPLIWSYLTLSLFCVIAFLVFSLVGLKYRYDDEKLYNKHKDELPQSVLVIDVGGLGQLRMANPKFFELVSKDVVKMITDVTKDKINIKETLKMQKAFFMGIETKEGKKDFRFVIVKKKRGYLLIGEEANKVTGFEGKYRDFALNNQITKLPNEMFLKETLESIDKNRKFSIVSFAVEDFDTIQNTIGREFARQFIKKLIDEIKKHMDKETMKFYHFTNDRYTVLVQNVLNYDMVDSWVQNVSVKINNSVILSDLPFTVSLKAGIVHNQGKVMSMDNDSILEILEITTERALKSTVYTHVQYNEKFLEYTSKNQQMELDLQKGIANDEFEMYLQPQYNVETNKTVGFELLLRWNNPKYQKESPASYVKIAEKSNLIIDLGRLIIDKVFTIAESFNKTDIEFSFNISPRQLVQPGFIQELIDFTKKYDVNPERIAIELTETILVVSFDLIIEKFKALKQLGFKIHLDDFGTGYSSLSYLKTLPVDVIKIDKKFVDEIETSFTSRQILKTMTMLGKNLKLGVIFEGVETEKQVEIIKKEGGEIIQGFVIARPMPHKDAKDFLKKKKVGFSE